MRCDGWLTHPGLGVVGADGGRVGRDGSVCVGQPGAGSIARMVVRAVVMWSAQVHRVGRRSRRRRLLVTSRAGAQMIVVRSVLVVMRPRAAALAVQRARL